MVGQLFERGHDRGRVEGKLLMRMGKDNFYKLCGELRPFIERKDMDMYTLGI